MKINKFRSLILKFFYKMNFSKLNKDYLIARQSPIDCSTLKVASYYLVLIFVIGVVSNTLLIWILCSNKKLRTNLSIYILVLSVINLMATLTEVPIAAVNNYNCR